MSFKSFKMPDLGSGSDFLKKIKPNIFSVVTMLLGLILLSYTVSTQSKLPLSCTSEKVQMGLNFMTMICVMLVVLPVTHLMCNGGCICKFENVNYRYIVSFLLLILGVTGAIIWSDLKDNCDEKQGHEFIGFITVFGIVLSMLVFFGPMILQKLKIYL